MDEKTDYTVTITEALKLYNGKVSRTIYTNWVNREDYGLKAIKKKGIWYINEESVLEARKLYKGQI